MKVGASEWGLERGECEDLYDLKTSSMHLGTSAPLKLRRLERSNGTKFSFKKINLSYFACEQKQEDVNCTVGWLRKRGQVVESVIQTGRNQNHQNHKKVKNLAPVIYSTINVTFRDSSTDCFGQLLYPNKPSALKLNKFTYVVSNRRNPVSSHTRVEKLGHQANPCLVIQTVAAKHVQSTQWYKICQEKQDAVSKIRGLKAHSLEQKITKDTIITNV